MFVQKTPAFSVDEIDESFTNILRAAYLQISFWYKIRTETERSEKLRITIFYKKVAYYLETLFLLKVLMSTSFFAFRINVKSQHLFNTLCL